MKYRHGQWVLTGVLLLAFAVLIVLALSFDNQKPADMSIQAWPGGGGDQLMYGVLDSLTPVPVKVSGQSNDRYGAIDVYIQDQHSLAVFVPFHIHTGITATLLVTASPGDLSLTLTPTVHSVVASNTIAFGKTDAWWYGRVYTTSGAVITLDHTINVTYDIGTIVEVLTDDLNLDASSASIQSHVYSVPSIDFDITAIRIYMICQTEPDDSKFCDQSALARGVFLRRLDGETGLYQNLGNVKVNGSFVLFAGDVEYTDKAGGGSYSVRVDADFIGGLGITLRLRGATTGAYTTNGRDELHIILQDDLTGVESIRVMAVGHVVQD